MLREALSDTLFGTFKKIYISLQPKSNESMKWSDTEELDSFGLELTGSRHDWTATSLTAEPGKRVHAN